MIFGFFKKKLRPEHDRVRVMYLCDRKMCNTPCNPECRHTLDIRHAKNFTNPFYTSNLDGTKTEYYMEVEHETRNDADS